MSDPHPTAPTSRRDLPVALIVALVIVVWPVGITLMWLRTSWALWVKSVVTVAAALVVVITAAVTLPMATSTFDVTVAPGTASPATPNPGETAPEIDPAVPASTPTAVGTASNPLADWYRTTATPIGTPVVTAVKTVSDDVFTWPVPATTSADCTALKAAVAAATRAPAPPDTALAQSWSTGLTHLSAAADACTGLTTATPEDQAAAAVGKASSELITGLDAFTQVLDQAEITTHAN